jgi:hypothetical protein
METAHVISTELQGADTTVKVALLTREQGGERCQWDVTRRNTAFEHQLGPKKGSQGCASSSDVDVHLPTPLSDSSYIGLLPRPA